jgi:RimJ/RimL family protein N-acetyltransferase
MDKIELRLLRKEDTSVTWQWRNQAAVRDHFSGHPFSVTKEQEEEWFENQVRNNESLVAFAVCRMPDKRMAGMTFLKHINSLHRQAEFAILIDEKFKGEGLGKEACHKTLLHAFRELNLHRVFLKVRTDNLAAIRVYEYCGFKKEGELRDDVYKNNSFRNQFIMAILETEFKD